MLTKTSQFFARYANGWLILFFLALQVLFNVVVFPHFQAHDAQGNALPVLDLMFGFSNAEAFKVIWSYGAEGREKMLFIAQVIDSIYPFVYTLLDILAISFLFKKFLPANSKMHLLNLLPILAFVFDFIENFFIARMLKTFPDMAVGDADLASLFNQLKWIAAAVCMVAIVRGLIGWAIAARAKRRVRKA